MSQVHYYRLARPLPFHHYQVKRRTLMMNLHVHGERIRFIYFKSKKLMNVSNTVMYNLISACAYCQGGDPTDFKTWTEGCENPAEYMSFPQGSLGVVVKTPLWAFTNVTSDGTFDLISIQKGTYTQKSFFNHVS